MNTGRLLITTAIIIAAICVSSLCVNLGAQNLRVAFIGDPQVDSQTELDYARKSVYRDLAQEKNLDFVVILGDLVNDKPELLRQSKAILDSLPFPCFVVPGNHDFDDYGGHSKQRDLKTFNDVIGPSDTVFVAGNYRFVLMNNVRMTDIRDYEGGFSESQKSWLDSLVGESSKDRRKLVLCTHIPLSYSKGLDSLSVILSTEADYLLVSGHTHSVKRHNFRTSDGREIPELIVGATCGSWWRGVKGPDGVPYALQNCGAPRGYFIAEMGRRDIKLSYSVIDKSSRAFVKESSTVDNMTSSSIENQSCVAGNESLSAHIYGDSLLVINVFAGAEDGMLKVRSKSGSLAFPSQRKAKFIRSTQPHRREMTAPEVEKEILRNANVSRQERREKKNDFIPLRRKKSPHVWTANCHFAFDKASARVSMDKHETKPCRIKVSYRDSMMKFCKTVEANPF